jgi:hypothetical protein
VLVCPTEFQADDLKRWQASQHIVQACWVERCRNESNLQAGEATQVTDACLHGEKSSSEWVADSTLKRIPVGQASSRHDDDRHMHEHSTYQLWHIERFWTPRQ